MQVNKELMQKAYDSLATAIKYEQAGNIKFAEMSLKLACRRELEALGFPIPAHLASGATPKPM